MLARRLLAEKLEMMEKGQGSRLELRRAGLRKKKASASKKKKRKYRSLMGEEEKDEGDGESDGSVDGEKHEGGAFEDDQSHHPVEKKGLS